MISPSIFSITIALQDLNHIESMMGWSCPDQISTKKEKGSWSCQPNCRVRKHPTLIGVSYVI